QHEPRFRGGARGDARACARDARVAVRRQQLRDRADRPAGVQRAIPPRSEPRTAGQLLSVREIRGGDGVSVVLAVALAAGPVPVVRLESFKFKDWEIACDGLRYTPTCTANHPYRGDCLHMYFY